nr:uncharacterized protein LOC113812545 [Penaeus vannamei]
MDAVNRILKFSAASVRGRQRCRSREITGNSFPAQTKLYSLEVTQHYDKILWRKWHHLRSQQEMEAIIRLQPQPVNKQMVVYSKSDWCPASLHPVPPAVALGRKGARDLHLELEGRPLLQVYRRRRCSHNCSRFRTSKIHRMKLLLICVLVCALGASHGREEEDGRLVARFSTRTLVSVITTTATVPQHCILGVATPTCTNRRRRRDLVPITAETDDRSLLEGSQELSERVERDVEDRDPRVGFTLWKTVTPPSPTPLPAPTPPPPCPRPSYAPSLTTSRPSPPAERTLFCCRGPSA